MTQPLTTTTLQLNQANYIVQKYNVVGQGTSFRLLGLITIIPAMRVKAFTKMHEKAGLKPGGRATPAHLLVEESNPYFLLFSIPRVRVRTDFIMFQTKQTGGESGNAMPNIRGQPVVREMQTSSELPELAVPSSARIGLVSSMARRYPPTVFAVYRLNQG
ncbi:MAG TPA: hypothetical protein VL171_10245 [Verrucomicrobiae bacterium]|nr:hypothetical protein [Verrucomicrobiae bacterium]